MSEALATITEADVLAYLKAQTAIYAPMLPELCGVYCGVLSTHKHVSIFGAFRGSAEMTLAPLCWGETFPHAYAMLRGRLGSVANQAGKKRAEAARLIAQADELEGSETK